VILPKRNERDLDDVPQEAREAMEFIFAEDMTEVIAAALEATPSSPEVGPKSAVSKAPEALPMH
jgi:ATP-dependent Lon protease